MARAKQREVVIVVAVVVIANIIVVRRDKELRANDTLKRGEKLKIGRTDTHTYIPVSSMDLSRPVEMPDTADTHHHSPY